MRGVAVLLVLLHHFVEMQLPRKIGSWQAYLAASLGLSFSGVDLFFVISGFLIGGILLDNQGAPNFYQTFYVRRALRIIPLYYLFLLICWAVPGRVPGVSQVTYPFGSYLSFFCNFSMAAGNMWDAGWPALAWSLAVEEQFYLVFPLLVRACSRKTLLGLVLGALVISPVLRVSILHFTPQYSLATHILPLCRMDCLAFGVLAAQAVRYERTRRWLEANSMVPGYFALTLLPILAYLTLSRAAIQSLPMATFGYTTLGLFYTAVLLAVLYRKPGFLYWFCNTKPLVFVGGISYFIYLFQGVVGWMTFRAFGHDTISLCSLTDVSLFALSVIAIAGIGALSWILFESRLIDLGRNFRYQ